MPPGWYVPFPSRHSGGSRNPFLPKEDLQFHLIVRNLDAGVRRHDEIFQPQRPNGSPNLTSVPGVRAGSRPIAGSASRTMVDPR